MLFLYILLLNLTLAHDLHVSKSLVKYDAEAHTLEIELHIFLDDLEASLYEGGIHDRLNLCTEKEHPKGDEYVEKYLNNRFRIMVNGEERKCEYISKKISDDYLATYCYLRVPNVTKIENIGVKNVILMELYDDQRNIVEIVVPNQKKKFFMFNRKYNEDFVEF